MKAAQFEITNLSSLFDSLQYYDTTDPGDRLIESSIESSLRGGTGHKVTMPVMPKLSVTYLD
jgi:hypothetical protein